MSEHHGDTCDLIFDQAPFCAGPSMRECVGGIEVPEDSSCPGNDTSALGAIDPDPTQDLRDLIDSFASCEEDGSCDDSCTPPARGDCMVESVTEPPVPPVQPDTLPATGTMEFLLLWVAIGMITVGVALHMAMTDLMESGR